MVWSLSQRLVSNAFLAKQRACDFLDFSSFSHPPCLLFAFYAFLVSSLCPSQNPFFPSVSASFFYHYSTHLQHHLLPLLLPYLFLWRILCFHLFQMHCFGFGVWLLVFLRTLRSCSNFTLLALFGRNMIDILLFWLLFWRFAFLCMWCCCLILTRLCLHTSNPAPLRSWLHILRWNLGFSLATFSIVLHFLFPPWHLRSF